MKTEVGKKSYYGDAHYKSIIEFAKKKGIEDNIVFHPWIPFNLMPQYYSLGKLALCIGRFIESFGGNSSIESILCGTPVILSRVGAQRTTLPENVIDKIDVGDIKSMERKTVKILKEGRNLTKAQKFIKKNYNFEKMLRGYEAILVNARPLPKLSVIHQTTQTSRVKVAPWCYVTKSNKIYNDYLYAYTKISKQMRDLLKKDKILQLKQISSSNLLKEIKKLMKQGILVPEN